MFNLILLALLWGPSFVFIKIASNELPIITLVAWRIFSAATLLLIYIRLKKISFPSSPKIWAHAAIQSVFSCSAPFILFGYSMLYVPSILGGCINGTVPMLTALIAHFCINGERLTSIKVTGILFGLAGFIVLFLPTLLDGSFDSDSWSLLACLGASLCYAIGMVYARVFLNKLPKYTGPGMQLITASMYLIPMMLIFDPLINPISVSMTVAYSMIGLSVLGTTLAFIVYFKIIEKSGATFLSMVAYLLPISTAIFGFIFLGEKPSKTFMVAICLIMVGLLCVNKKPHLGPQGLPRR